MALPRPLVGAPNSATGGVFKAPLGTALPTDEKTQLDKAFKAQGLVGQDGVTTHEDRSTEDIRDWSGVIVRTLQKEYGMTVELEFLETNLEVLKTVFGDDNVTEADGLITLVHNADESEPACFVFEIKDGKDRIRIVLPNAQVTNVDDRTYNKQDVVRYKVTITAYPDESGNNGYEYIRIASAASSSSM